MRLNLSLHIPLRSPVYSQHSVTITPFSWVCFESVCDNESKIPKYALKYIVKDKKLRDIPITASTKAVERDINDDEEG